MSETNTALDSFYRSQIPYFTEFIIISSIKYLATHPLVVLLESLLEVDHPVAERFESLRSEAAPDVRDESVKQGAGDVIQLTAHTHLTRQRLQHKGQRSTQRNHHIQGQHNTPNIS